MIKPAQGYYRFPAIHKNLIMFTAEGDLWRVSTRGGTAQRLTTHHGVESHAAISPDGTMVAFSAQYEGPTEVYVMSVQGGRPLRLTYEDSIAKVVGWTPDGKVMYSTQRYSTLPSTQLCTIHPDTFEHAIIPLAEASDGMYDTRQKTLFFTRYPFQGSFTKRYKGGTVQNIWKFAPKKEAVPLTADYAGTSKTPMVHGNRVFFASDRDGTMNLWSMSKNGKRLKQHTFHKAFDVQSPALHNGRIVYQWQADLYLYDIEKEKTRRLNITLSSDFDQKRTRWVHQPLRYLDAWYPSPNGDRVVLTARGRLFVAPVENGRFVEVTTQNDGRFRSGQFTPDGEHLFAYSDETGELELYLLAANGLKEPQQITDNSDIHRYESVISPDGKYIAFSDKKNRLWLTDIVKKETELLAESETSPFYSLAWAPDSHWLAFVEVGANQMAQVKIMNMEAREITAVTSDRVISFSPAWSPDGRWLCFLSERHFHSLVSSPWGARQPEPYMDSTTLMYMVSLQKENHSPFVPPDEVELERRQAEAEEKRAKDDKEKKKSKKEQPKEKEEKEKCIEIDLDGIQHRLFEIPVPPGNHRALAINDKFLFWVDIVRNSKPKVNLFGMKVTHEEPEPVQMMSDIRSYDLSAEGNKILVRQKQNLFMIDAIAKTPKQDDKKRVNLSRWRFTIDLRQEWRQMFREAWRLERDYFYDPGLHGVDWEAILERHLPLLDRVTDRDEFNDLLAQMVGELSALHIFVHSGDRRSGRDRIFSGALGVRWSRDEKAGGYRIDQFYETDPDYPHRLGPLRQPDSQIEVGDVVEEINGRSLISVPNPAILLQNQAGKQVRLHIQRQKKRKNAKPIYFDTIVTPISPKDEQELRYDDWEYRRRLMVEDASDDTIGYVHLRAMREANFSEWTRNYYPVFNRQGLIIDARHNRGGNIDSWILSRLMRKAWFYWAPREGQPYWNMHYAFRGHMAVLVNGRTASDGEVLADGFRRLGLGKVIGTRTWGGEIWLSRNTWLADKGIATAAQTGVYMDGEWLIEGHGLDPDIVVDNLPHETYLGHDAQLNAAITHLQTLITTDPRPVPTPPPYPDKSFDYFEP